MKKTYRLLKALPCLVLLIFSSCDNSSKSEGSYIKAEAVDLPHDFSPKVDAYYLFKLARDCNTKRGFDKKIYSRTISICCLMGLPERLAVNFITEQKGVDFSASFDGNDPLGWSDDLKGGAIITIHADLGIIVLEYPPHSKTGNRDIKDVIQYSPKDHPGIGSDFYTQLPAMVRQSVDKANAQYDKVISR